MYPKSNASVKAGSISGFPTNMFMAGQLLKDLVIVL
jgi:hypothetical protein